MSTRSIKNNNTKTHIANDVKKKTLNNGITFLRNASKTWGIILNMHLELFLSKAIGSIIVVNVATVITISITIFIAIVFIAALITIAIWLLSSLLLLISYHHF